MIVRGIEPRRFRSRVFTHRSLFNPPPLPRGRGRGGEEQHAHQRVDARRARTFSNRTRAPLARRKSFRECSLGAAIRIHARSEVQLRSNVRCEVRRDLSLVKWRKPLGKPIHSSTHVLIPSGCEYRRTRCKLDRGKSSVLRRT